MSKADPQVFGKTYTIEAGFTLVWQPRLLLSKDLVLWSINEHYGTKVLRSNVMGVELNPQYKPNVQEMELW